MRKIVLIYDGSFKGFLTSVFKIYSEKLDPVNILPTGVVQKQIFSEEQEVFTDDKKAKRILKGLQQRIGHAGIKKIQWAFLSEKEGIELLLFRMIKYIFSTHLRASIDYSNPDVLAVTQTANKVGREKHRMEAFVRFRLTKDTIYFAVIEPDYNVLPLITKHFKNRYTDQKWLIYDLRRKFGIYYDLTRVEYISLELPEDIGITGANPEYFEASEIRFQKLWREYFNSTSIKNRTNMRLHVQHVPKRYWKYLSEKSPFV